MLSRRRQPATLEERIIIFHACIGGDRIQGGTVASVANGARPYVAAMPEPTDEQIRTRAHQLWELTGRPEGREEEFWHGAECELRGGATNNPD